MKNYVISLSNESQRRKHIHTEFGKEGLAFEFFDAITPVTLLQTAHALGIKVDTTDLHPNEVACILSHAILWKKAVDENLDYIAIFEDDIYLGKFAQVFLKDSHWISEQCGIIKLETLYRKVFISRKEETVRLHNQRELMVLDSPHMGAGGYILSRRAAESLLDFTVKLPKLIPIDHIIFRIYPEESKKKVYQLSPALCIQDVILTKGETNFPSSLEEVRNIRKGESKVKKKLSLQAKAIREFSRPFLQIFSFIQTGIWFIQGKKLTKIKFE
ncbi:glycosyltransferase family 25 protein [Acinetobacter haemolyticus]|uniref:glycosyltransferase family 25 protein n=1 Tax=Acinetobacter haemolyticus TaxID=29430 RepID=UPI000D698AC1|nr:glycosyltransferase family 25 protein [Acinetobacter haemolyticus]